MAAPTQAELDKIDTHREISWDVVDAMTLAQAEKIMALRFNGPDDFRGTWRSVAEQMGDPDGNQLYGMDICQQARKVLAEEWVGGSDF